jgi:membrane protease YdiL (CAAX protease family)
VNPATQDELEPATTDAPSARLPLLVLIVGAAVLAVGLVMLAVVGRGAISAAMAPSPTAALGALLVLLGGGGACVGLIGLTLGWGRIAWPLPLGSHRATIASLLLALTLAGLLVGAYRALAPPELGRVGLLAVGGLGLYGGLILVAYVRGVRTGLMRDALAEEGVGVKQVVEAVRDGVVGTMALLLVSAVSGLVMRAVGVENPQRESLGWVREGSSLEIVLAGIGIVLVAPIVEEVFFRGYVFRGYLAAKDARTAFIGSALLWSVIHGLPALIPALFVMGLILAYLYRRSGTLLAPVVAHILNNGVAFAALLAAAST